MLTGLHLLLTYSCTQECDHCHVYSGPDAEGTFTSERLGEALAQAREVGTIETVWFEGGEPFLHYPLLEAGIEAAAQHGFETGIVTNAYWARSAEDAELWLRPLAERGLGSLSLSQDDYHRAAAGDASPRHVTEAAKRLGLSVSPICIGRPGAHDGPRLQGRAADRLTGGLERQPWESFARCEDEPLEDPQRVHLDAYGNVHLCLGILLGNAWEAPLATLLSNYDAQEHPVVGPILRGGPAGLAREHSLPHQPTYASACHFCHRLRAQLVHRLPAVIGPRQLYGLVGAC